FEAQDAGREKIGQWGLHLDQAPHMGDVARPLEREDEVPRDPITPGGEAFRPLQGIESSVDFDRGELAGRMGEFVLLPEVLGVEFPPPRRIAPTGDADTGLGHRTSPSKYRARTRRGGNDGTAPYVAA